MILTVIFAAAFALSVLPFADLPGLRQNGLLYWVFNPTIRKIR